MDTNIEMEFLSAEARDGEKQPFSDLILSPCHGRSFTR